MGKNLTARERPSWSTRDPLHLVSGFPGSDVYSLHQQNLLDVRTELANHSMDFYRGVTALPESYLLMVLELWERAMNPAPEVCPFRLSQQQLSPTTTGSSPPAVSALSTGRWLGTEVWTARVGHMWMLFSISWPTLSHCRVLFFTRGSNPWSGVGHERNKRWRPTPGQRFRGPKVRTYHSVRKISFWKCIFLSLENSLWETRFPNLRSLKGKKWRTLGSQV